MGRLAWLIAHEQLRRVWRRRASPPEQRRAEAIPLRPSPLRPDGSRLTLPGRGPYSLTAGLLGSSLYLDLVVVQVVAGSSPVAHPKYLQIRHYKGTDPGKLFLLPSRS